MTELSGWGRYPRHTSRTLTPPDMEAARNLTSEQHRMVARGNGRSYGDAAIGVRTTVMMRGLDRMRAFDAATGLLTVEAGVMLADIIACFLPRGFFPPVVPGTRFVTVGGMIASDVHGKNQHHHGTFGDHVETLILAVPGQAPLVCSRDSHAELFYATIGGMGLTGTILEASFRLMPVETGWIRQETLVAANLSEALDLLRRTSDTTYSVAWIDVLARGQALGRSLVYAGEHAVRTDLPLDAAPVPPARTGHLGVPVDFPHWALNRLSVSAFNTLYFRRGASRAGMLEVVPWDSYFFPLDGIRDWNRIYGRSGFVQHQCVVPDKAAEGVLAEVLDRIAAHGKSSFLAVLKRMRRGSGMMSFPMDGYTLALDLPLGEGVLDLLQEIDGTVAAAGGRLYLAKDARQSRDTFEAGYPELAGFRRLRTDTGARERIMSHLAMRLDL